MGSFRFYNAKRLSALLVGLVVFGAFCSRMHAETAQQETDVASEFLALLTTRDYDQAEKLVSHSSFAQLGTTGVETLLQNWPLKPSKIETHVNAAAPRTVIITPFYTAKALVCVDDYGEWRIDLVKAFAAWNGLNEEQNAERICDITGVALSENLPPPYATKACFTNLRQLELGIRMYTLDYDDTYPRAQAWCDEVDPYLKNDRLFHCPTAGHYKYGYAMNWKLSQKVDSRVPSPFEMPLIYETSVLHRNQGGEGKDLAFRHQGAANFAFCDGHVKLEMPAAAPSFNFLPRPSGS